MEKDIKLEELPIKKNNELDQEVSFFDTPTKKLTIENDSHDNKDITLQELFEACAQKNAQQISVIFEKKSITYQELNKKSNQLAHYLQSKYDLYPDDLVALCFDRSEQMIMAILAVLKAGGAYVPIDPNNPEERIAYILQDTKAKLVISQQVHENKLASLIEKRQLITSIEIIDSNLLRNKLTAYPENNPLSNCQPHHLAYVIYTSGTTGKPKGVLIEHRNVINLLQSLIHNYNLAVDEKFILFANYVFDASVEQIFLPLLMGNILYVVTQEIIQDASLFTNFIWENRISHLHVTPPYLQNLEVSKLIHLKRLVVAGEYIHHNLFSRCMNYLPQVINAYGPTEATVISLLCKNANHIGKPIANVTAYILDANLNPVPMGAIGELYIAGAGVARGYLNLPELTAERFITNCFQTTEEKQKQINTKLYKTGDLVRCLSDGNLEYIGRNDFQIKIQGYRIELGEIEFNLNLIPEIKQAIVIVHHKNDGNKILMAFYVLKAGKWLNQFALRNSLHKHLPHYMIPHIFVELDELPINNSHKIDRNLLTEQSTKFLSNELTTYVAPTSIMEENLVHIWSSVLKQQPIGIHDNFFLMGGNSLSAFQIFARIKKQFSVELTITKVFVYNTIAKLAEYIEHMQSMGVSENFTFIDNLSIQHELNISELSLYQKRLWLLDQLQPGSCQYNIPIALRLQGALDSTLLEKAIVQVVKRHDSFRTIFLEEQGEVKQKICEISQLNFLVLHARLTIDDSSQIDQQLQNLAIQEAHIPFNLTHGPLIRAKIYQIDSEDYLLLINVHHIIFDAWSLKVFCRELKQFYESFLHNRNPDLIEEPVQYSHFVNLQRNKLEKDSMQSKIEYWQEQLKNFCPLFLPADYPRNFQGQPVKNEIVSFNLNFRLVSNLKKVCQQRNVTLFMGFLTSFYILLHRYTDQKDLLMGTPISDRDSELTENIIGFLVNTLALRIIIKENSSFNELLNDVKLMTLQAYENNLPFEKILEHLNIPRDHNFSIFNVWFVFENINNNYLELENINATEILPNLFFNHFDLTLYLKEQGEEIQASFIYRNDLFSKQTIKRMSEHWQVLLENMLKQADTSISKLPMLTELEQKALIGDASLSFDNNMSVAERFEQQVQTNPTHCAINTINYQWNYLELNEQANLICNAILNHGFNESVRVALLIEHDAPMIAAMLGVMKAGHTYIPLNTEYPIRYLRSYIKDSAPLILIADRNHRFLAHALSLNQRLVVINLEKLSKIENLLTPRQVTLKDPAYLIYTSGSTGKPKGVLQNQENLLHFNQIYTKALQITYQDKLSLLSGYHFDAAVMDIYGALLNGAALYSFPIRAGNPEDYMNWLRQHEITIYHSTPTLFRYIFGDITHSEKLSSLRYVVLGGEAVTIKDVELFLKFCNPQAKFVNGYGPTESTISTQFILDHEKAEEYVRKNSSSTIFVPIGRPVNNTEIVLLNSQRDSDQILGEIGIKSSYLALKYWNQDDLTEVVFLQQHESRIYCTGDYGYLLPSGDISFLGRKDEQIKINGYRVELNEIQTQLESYPDVKQCVILVKMEKGEKYLVAYLVFNVVASSLLVQDHLLRNFLKERLPHFMTPRDFIVINEIPLLANGKIDKQVLSSIVPESISSQFVAPSSYEEQCLMDIWCKELSLDKKISINDNFFALGGDSIKLARLKARIQSEFNLDFPLKKLFEYATIKEFAAYLASFCNRGKPVVEYAE